MSDEAFDYLATDGTLYCSMDCLRADGADFERTLESDEYSEGLYGTFCPFCNRTFHCIEDL